jgi:PTS system nitrogen regulatory IIA component
MYLNLTQLAESFGVSEKIVIGWIRNEGLPHTPDRGVLLFDHSQVAQWAATRGLAVQAGFLATEKHPLASVLRLGPLLRAGGIWREVVAADLPGVFARVAAALPGASPPVREMLAKRFQAIGGITIAPIGGGYALPHPSTRVTLGRDSGSMALILLRDSLPPQDLRVDEVPIKRLLFFIAPSPRAHLDMVGRISRLLSARVLRDALDLGATDEDIYQIIADADVAAAEAKNPEVKG